jgi:hypothetical protein
MRNLIFRRPWLRRLPLGRRCCLKLDEFTSFCKLKMDTLSSLQSFTYLHQNTCRHWVTGAYLLCNYAQDYGIMHRRKLLHTKMNVPGYIGGPALQRRLHLDTLTCNKPVYCKTGITRFLWVWNQCWIWVFEVKVSLAITGLFVTRITQLICRLRQK